MGRAFIHIGTPDNGSWTWMKTSPKPNEATGIWASVALSYDGGTIMAVDQGGDVYSWTSSTNWTNSTNWTGLTASTVVVG